MTSHTSTFGGLGETEEQDETEGLLDASLVPELEMEANAAATGWRRFAYAVMSNRSLTITIAALVIFVYFSLAIKQFLSANNLLNVVRNMSLIGIVAVGMTFVLVAGEIDLSVGSVYGVLTVILGLLVSNAGLDPWLATLVVIALGLLIGIVNGSIVTRFGIPSFIVTLAMLTAYRSAALIISNQKPTTTQGQGLFYAVTGGSIGPVPWLIVWLLAVGVIGGVVLSTSRFGYHVYATGGSLEAARNSGIDARRVKIACFALTSGLCGLIAGLLWGYLHTAAPVTGTGFEFRVIGAVIVGGVVSRRPRDGATATRGRCRGPSEAGWRRWPHRRWW